MFIQLQDYPDYLVDDAGKVFSLKVGFRELSPCINSAGYPLVVLHSEGKRKSVNVHRLVAEAFLGKSGLQVNHKNGVKTDNALENLEYVTCKENISHAHRTGLSSGVKGQKNVFAKLTDAQALELIQLRGLMSQREAGERFGISRSAVSMIWSGKRRGHQH